MAVVEYYVTSAGAGTHDGLSLANAMTLAEAVTDYNAGPGGKRYNLQGAFSEGADRTFSGNSTIANPSYIRGYASAIGDGWQGRNADGTLNTTNYAAITFGAGFELLVSGAYIGVEAVNIIANTGVVALTVSGTGSFAHGCKVTNSNTGAGAHAMTVFHGSDLEAYQTGASGGAAALAVTAGGLVSTVRLKSTSGPGVVHSGGAFNLLDAIIYGCGTHGVASTATGAAAHLTLANCTIYNPATNGVDIGATFVAIYTQIRCHITDCGGYGVDANGATAAIRIIGPQRMRDNVTADFLIDAEWDDGKMGVITTDTGGAATDFEDAAALDFRLIDDAPGRDTSANGMNIGACGNDYPEAVAGGGGGRPRVVLIR